MQSPADIAAWIEERKKRFPTRARVQEAAEHKRALQEAQKTAKEAIKQTQEKKRSEWQQRRRQAKAGEDKKESEKGKADPKDVALKAKLKAEKLRKRLDKEEKKIAKAEAKAEEARTAQKGVSFLQSMVAGTKRKRGETDGATDSLSRVSEASAVSVKYEPSSEKRDEKPVTEATATTEPQAMESNPLLAKPDSAPEPTETSGIVYKTLNKKPSPLEDIAETDSESDDTMSISSSSPEPSSDDDDTSSSGSSSDEGAPDEATSKRNGPERVPPPKREKPRSRCTQFMKTGYCKRGNRCKFLHELPERGSSRAGPADGKKAVMKGKERSKPKRKSLYERVRVNHFHYGLVS